MLKDLITEDCIECAVPLTSKKRVLEEIAQLAAHKYAELDQHILLDSLMEREKMSSTGIGNGIAIPHGRLKNTERAQAVIVTTAQAIDFDAIDKRPVDTFIALFVPEASCKEHLVTLQSIAQLLQQSDVLKFIRQCQNPHQLFEYIQQH
jgi:PTS system nitrogen regulatory IIA component